MKVAIVKYNAGNIASVINALKRLGVQPILTDDPQELRTADKVIFPGQGEAGTAMEYLRSHSLDTLIRSLTNPVLGICIGQQLMCTHSEEKDTTCLGIFDVPVLRFIPKEHTQKVPHMGWNSLAGTSGPLMKGIVPGQHVYFVHSYYVPLCAHTAAQCEHIVPFSAALQKDNFYATQFHPEKSGSVGEQILQNFLQL